jgi:hypothetical protein
VDIRQIGAVTSKQQTSRNFEFTAMSLPGSLIANPVSSGAIAARNTTTPVPITRTIPQREVYTAIQADLHSLITSIQTEEQLLNLRQRLEKIRLVPQCFITR